MPFYTYLMLFGPLADLHIFVWSKMPLLPLFSHLLARGPRIIIFILRFFSNRPIYPQVTSPAVPLTPSGIRNLAVAPTLRRLPSAQILLRRPPLTPLYKILVRWVTDSQELRAQAPTLGMHSASSSGFLPLHPAHGPWDLGARTPPHDTTKAHQRQKIQAWRPLRHATQSYMLASSRCIIQLRLSRIHLWLRSGYCESSRAPASERGNGIIMRPTGERAGGQGCAAVTSQSFKMLSEKY